MLTQKARHKIAIGQSYQSGIEIVWFCVAWICGACGQSYQSGIEIIQPCTFLHTAAAPVNRTKVELKLRLARAVEIAREAGQSYQSGIEINVFACASFENYYLGQSYQSGIEMSLKSAE